MRLTTLRSLMFLIAIIAAALSVQRAFAKQQAKLEHYRAALDRYYSLKNDHDNGRVECVSVLATSEAVMKAQCDVSWGSKPRHAGITAHIRRAEQLRLYDDRCADTEIAKRSYARARARWSEEEVAIVKREAHNRPAALSARRLLEQQRRYESAFREYESLNADYDVGRVTGETLLRASKELMKAQYVLGYGNARMEAVAAHASRSDWVLRQEQLDLFHNYAGVAEARQFCREARMRLAEEMAK